MNPGNLIGLTILLAFTGCGAYTAWALFGDRGTAIGAIAGALVWFGLAIRASRRYVPPCLCGDVSNESYDVVKQAPRVTRFQCRACGRTYQIHRSLWSEVGPDGGLTPRMRRGRPGTWRPLD